MPYTVFAVDGGGSKTAAALFIDGVERARCVVGPANVYQNLPGAIAAIRQAWQTLAQQAALDPALACRATRLSAGLAGITGPDTLGPLRDAFAEFADCRFSSDGYIALTSAFAGRPGALLVAGTGMVGCRVDSAGQFQQLGGWGFPAGDRGSGAWLGLRLITDYLEQRDGHAGAGVALGAALEQPLVELIGVSRHAILGWLRTARSAQYASLAPLIIGAAANDNGYAQALLQQAFEHLLRLAYALRPSPSAPLCVAGGLADTFRPRLAAALGAALLADVRCEPLYGAYLIGSGQLKAEF